MADSGKSKAREEMAPPYYASTYALHKTDEDMAMPEKGAPSAYCLSMIEDYHLLDFSERLNTATYCNVVFEPDELKVAEMGLKVNLADNTVYPQSFKMHNDVVNMIAKLLNCPKPDDFDKYGCFAGAGTVGSTEACLLSGLAMKFRWRNWYGEKNGMDADQVRGVYPNMIISTMFQAAWEKLFKYFDIQPRFIAPSSDTMTLDPAMVAEAIDDKTIGVVCIMGNHYSGHYDPVWDIDAAIQQVNAEKGFQVGIHIDGASGAFVAPFQEGLPPWDFRLPTVLSVSMSGHKFGNSCLGTGWVIWRTRKDLSENVAITVSYLGGSADSYTLNFSRPAQSVYVQFYKFLRLGREGYQAVTDNILATSEVIRTGLREMTYNGQPRFTILDATVSAQKICLPVVAAMFNPELELSYDEVDLQHVVAQSNWYVSAHYMSMHHPVLGESVPLFSNQPIAQGMFRVVVKSNLTTIMAENLLKQIKAAVEFLDEHGSGFKHVKPKIAKGQAIHKTC